MRATPAIGPKADWQFLGNGARRLAQAPGELERNRHRQVAQHAARRRLDHDRRLIGFGQAKRLAEHLAQAQNGRGHGREGS